jgi:SAM-dependent methyltransferase
MNTDIKCPVCSETCSAMDVVDFNKSCEEARGHYLALSGTPIYYFYCNICHFCFAPEFLIWSLNDFENKIYNNEYVMVDPDYIKFRPENNARMLLEAFDKHKGEIKHLDFGGGNGLLSQQLRGQGWSSSSYDPFIDRGIGVEGLGRFNLITAFEVFEHVPDVKALMSDLSTLLEDRGIVVFTTLLSDNNIKPKARITWWYASPRNGHISLFSSESLRRLARQANLEFQSFSPGLHAFWNTTPPWAAHLIKPR